jgi:hypothetical protein
MMSNFQYRFILIAILTTVYSFGHFTEEEGTTTTLLQVSQRKRLVVAPVTTPTIITARSRGLGVALAPTPVPYEPPGFKPTVTPTDRTKRPTKRPTRPPTKRGPTRPPTQNYPCALCRPKERPLRPQEEIVFNGEFQTCQKVHSYGNLKGKIPPDKCDFYRNLGQKVCECRA